MEISQYITPDVAVAVVGACGTIVAGIFVFLLRRSIARVEKPVMATWHAVNHGRMGRIEDCVFELLARSARRDGEREAMATNVKDLGQQVRELKQKVDNYDPKATI